MAFVSLVSLTKRGMDRPQSVSRLELSAHAGRTLVQTEGWDRRIRWRLRFTPSGSLARIGWSTSRAFGRSGDCSFEWSSLFLERYKKQKGEALKAVLLQRLRMECGESGKGELGRPDGDWRSLDGIDES